MELEWICHVWPEIRLQLCHWQIMCLFSWSVSLFGNGNCTFFAFSVLKCHRRVNCTESLKQHSVMNLMAPNAQKSLQYLTPGVIDQRPSFQL